MKNVILSLASLLLIVALCYRALYPLHLPWTTELAIWTIVCMFLFVRFCSILFPGDN